MSAHEVKTDPGSDGPNRIDVNRRRYEINNSSSIEDDFVSIIDKHYTPTYYCKTFAILHMVSQEAR